MRINELPSQAELLHLFSYNPETGVLLWRNPPGRRLKPGQVAGNICPAYGYRVVGLTCQGRKLLLRVHRVVWKMMTGVEPPVRIDHINRDRLDNRWANLRDGSGTVNHDNKEYKRFGAKANEGLPTGISRHGRGYMAKRQNRYLGTFDTVEQARAAYLEALHA